MGGEIKRGIKSCPYTRARGGENADGQRKSEVGCERESRERERERERERARARARASERGREREREREREGGRGTESERTPIERKRE